VPLLQVRGLEDAVKKLPLYVMQGESCSADFPLELDEGIEKPDLLDAS